MFYATYAVARVYFRGCYKSPFAIIGRTDHLVMVGLQMCGRENTTAATLQLRYSGFARLRKSKKSEG